MSRLTPYAFRTQRMLEFKSVVMSKLKAIYILTPRVCSTSIKSALADKLGINYDVGIHKAKLPYKNGSMAGYRGYWKFAFVRNPWDRLLSAFGHKPMHPKLYKYGVKKGMGFEGFVRSICNYHSSKMDGHVASQCFLFINKFPDFIGRYENFLNDWEVVADRLGLAKPLPATHGTYHKHYREHYTPDMRDLVAVKFKDDIERFEYAF